VHDTKQDPLAGSVRKCFRCGDSSHMKKDGPVKEKCFKCDQPGRRAAQCKAEVQVKSERATNVVQDAKIVSQPSRESFSSSLEFKSVICRNSEFKGLVDTGA